MPQGAITIFEEFALYFGQDDVHDMNADTFNISWHTTDPTAALATPVWADVSGTECASGNGYTTGGEALTTTWTEAAGVATFATNGATITWTQNGSGPTDLKYMIIRNATAAAGNLVCYIDATSDEGTTAVSLQAGDVTWKANATGDVILTLTIT
jgi:hypothetical protein